MTLRRVLARRFERHPLLLRLRRLLHLGRLVRRARLHDRRGRARSRAANATNAASSSGSILFPSIRKTRILKFFVRARAPGACALRPHGVVPQIQLHQRLARLQSPRHELEHALIPERVARHPQRRSVAHLASASPRNPAPSARSLHPPSSSATSAVDATTPATSALAPSAPIIALARLSSARSPTRRTRPRAISPPPP